MSDQTIFAKIRTVLFIEDVPRATFLTNPLTVGEIRIELERMMKEKEIETIDIEAIRLGSEFVARAPILYGCKRHYRFRIVDCAFEEVNASETK